MAKTIGYKAFKEAILGDMTNFDPNKAYPTKPNPFDLISPGSKVRVTGILNAKGELDAYVNGIIQHFDGVTRWEIDWVSFDGAWRGTARVGDKDLAAQKQGDVFTVKADAATKTYAHPDHYAPGNFFGSSKTYVQSNTTNAPFPDAYTGYPYPSKGEAQADLSQIEADLAKLPKAPWGQSPLQTLKEALISPAEFAEKYATTSGGADMGPLTYDDLKTAMDSISKETGKSFANSEKVMQATQEQMTKFGEVFLKSIKGDLVPIDADKVEVKWNTDGLIESITEKPIGKLHEYKLTEGGLEATFTMEGPPTSTAPTFTKVPAKSNEQRAEDAMKEATLEAVETLWVGLHGLPWPDKLNTLNGVDTFQLDDGTMLEVLLTVKPKEETHDH